MLKRLFETTLSLFVVVFAATSGVAQSERTIPPNTTISVTVGRWDPVAETFTAWPELGGQFIVDSDGGVVLPMVGEVSASDMTPNALGDRVARTLGTRMGLVGEVSATVSIAAYEPVYLSGDIRAPGAYAFKPSMTVLQAVSVAGGMRPAETAFLRSERTAVSTLGEYRVLELNLMRNLAALARLEAELNEESQIDMPEDLAGAPLADRLMEQERAIRAARQNALESSLNQLDDLEALLQDRIARIDMQIELRESQLALAEEELENAAALIERGLSVESRRSGLQQRIADQEVRRLELETARLNAEQQLNELGRERSDLINERRKALVEQISSVELEIEKLRVRMDTQAALYAEALRQGDGFVTMGNGASAPVYTIVRRGPDGVSEIQADAATVLEPGDVLTAEFPQAEEMSRTGYTSRVGTPLESIIPDTIGPDTIGSVSQEALSD